MKYLGQVMLKLQPHKQLVKVGSNFDLSINVKEGKSKNALH